MPQQKQSTEDYIQYLYNEIDSLKQKLSESELQCKEYSSQLKDCKKECDSKEKFILFRESQLSEAEETINKLKEQILVLSNKMSASGSTDPSGSGSTGGARRRSRSRSQARGEYISLDTLPTDQLFDKVHNNSEELLQYATGTRRLENVHISRNLHEQIARALELIRERYDITEQESTQEIANLRTEIFNLNQSLEGAHEDVNHKDERIRQLEIQLNELGNRNNEANLYNERLLAESRRLEGNYDTLTNELRRHLNQAEQEVININVLLNQSNIRLANLYDERDILLARYMTEQLITKSLKRQKLALKLTNRQLQIRLMNAPINPPPQPINEIWLLLH